MARQGAWPLRARKFWDQRQKRAKPGALTGYLLDESPASIGKHRFEGEWAQVQGWMKRWGVGKGNCLDLGCGTGIWLKAFAGEFTQVEGWDLSPEMIKASRRTLKKAGIRNATLRCGQISARKGKQAFDLIFVGGVLMYTPDSGLGPLLRNLACLVKPGGLILFRESVSAKGNWLREGLALRSGLTATREQRKALDYVAAYRSAGDYAARMRQAGLVVEALRPNRHYKLSDLTEDWLRRLDPAPAKAASVAAWIQRLRFLLLYPEYFLRGVLRIKPWELENKWFLCALRKRKR